MYETIGTAAGTVWAYLEKNGAASATKIGNETQLAKNDVQRAIGWLAREEKVDIKMEGRFEVISLR